ncbi:MAG: gpW family head-tail joining protein [Roseibium sp.]|uniref:gpW family head-tail joining protein n=1 Tax=Alphaproteobacteria TaxID=28211 RepID=UPI003263ADF8
MSVSSMVQIGKDTVDLNKPCDVVTALRKVKLSVVTGGIAQTVRLDGEEVTFTKANLTALNALIAEYETACARASGKTSRGRARCARWG